MITLNWAHHKELDGLLVMMILHDAAGVDAGQRVGRQFHETVRIASVIQVMTDTPNKEG